MITALIIFGILSGGGVGGLFGYRKLTKRASLRSFERLYSTRNLLNDTEWKELKRTIVEDCKGYFYADALITEVVNQGYRFTCKQIYELRDIYESKQEKAGWLGKKIDAANYVNKLTQYEYALKVDAEEKIFKLLHEQKEQLLLTE